jgi:hypothetical protein
VRSAALPTTSLALLALAALSLRGPATPSPREIPWTEALGPGQARSPEPLAKVVWRTDLSDAIAEARESGRPLFVTLRCLPCKQCAGFDQAVLEGSPQLDPLLAQFVTVRLTDANAIDLAYFGGEGWQDFDLSWWGFFLSPQGQRYAIFGGKDHVSDATRVSPAALAATLRRVLEHHYDPRRASWGLDGEPREYGGANARWPSQLEGFAAWNGRRPAKAREEGCLHCHQVNEILREPALRTKSFDASRDLDVWPLPENVGLVLERDDGLLVTRVLPGSAAEAAGVRAGDRLAAAGDRKLFGQADLRGVLHRGPRGAGTVELRWRRGEELRSAVLELREGWRKTELGWRKSVADGNIGAPPGFAWPLAAGESLRRKLGIPAGSMAVTPFFGDDPASWPAHRAGLRADDVIVAVGGRSPDLAQREFMTWFRLRYQPGDEVVLTVRDARGRDRELRYAAAPPRGDE